MSQWVKILDADEINARKDFTAQLDPTFAAREHAFYASRTAPELKALVHQAWLTNSPTGYQLARSYLALC